MIGSVFHSISKPPCGEHSVISAGKYSPISNKITNLGHHFSTGNVMMSDNERHPLLLECFITFHRRIRMIKRKSHSTYDPLVINTVSVLFKNTPKFEAKEYTLWGTRSAQVM